MKYSTAPRLANYNLLSSATFLGLWSTHFSLRHFHMILELLLYLRIQFEKLEQSFYLRYGEACRILRTC